MNGNDELSNRELTWGYWYLLHKEVIHRWVVRCLVVVNILLFAFSGYSLFRLFLWDQQAFDAALVGLSSNYAPHELLREVRAPLPLDISSPTVLAGGKGKYDFVVRVRNPNPAWTVLRLMYHVEAGGRAYPGQQSFLFPGQEKFFVDLNEEASSDPLGATFVVDDIAWQRIKDGGAFEQERFQFTTENVRFIPPQGQEESTGFGQTVFTLTNTSAYNFWSVGVLVAALSGDRVRAINRVSLDHVQSHESREVRVPWFEPLAGISAMDVAVDVNVYDPAVFESIRGGPLETQ